MKVRRNHYGLLSLGSWIMFSVPGVCGQDQPAEKNPSTPKPTRQFDFWVGDWDVFNPTGTQVGTNSITRNHNGFLLIENWQSARGGTGGQ